MLAGKAPEDLSELRLPLYASPKIDAIRCRIIDGVATSRSGKPLPNQFVQSILGDPAYNGLDGELAVGPPNAPNAMQAAMSGIMSRNGSPEFHFYAFDIWIRGTTPYREILTDLQSRADSVVTPLEQQLITNIPDLEAYESECLSAGYEGVVTRLPHSPYKPGRSTEKQQYLLKLKRRVRDEALVIGFKERMHNANALESSELGYAKRSTHKSGMVPDNTLGALICRTPQGTIFDLGTGFNEAQRAAIWATRDTHMSKLVTYEHFAQTGVVEKPRQPVFISFRDMRDL
jgi:DNA ligase-1